MLKFRYNYTYMSLQIQIKGELKDAMRAKDTLRLSVIRSILTGFQNELVAKKRPPSEKLEDMEALSVIKRLSRQRNDSIEQFRKGNREELALKEEQELAILKSYLPEEISREEIERLVKAKKEALGVADKSDIGKLIGAAMAELKDQADGKVVKEIAEAILSL